jgi:phage gpG-like protein
MSTRNPFQERAERVKKLVKSFMQEVPNSIYAYVIGEMGEDIGAEAFAKGEDGQALSLRAPRNETDKLRFQTNRLGRALAPNEDGNISIVGQKDGQLYVMYGINLKAVPYARIHEFGGKTGRGGSVTLRARPYLRPGFQKYLDKQVPRFIKRLAKELQ